MENKMKHIKTLAAFLCIFGLLFSFASCRIPVKAQEKIYFEYFDTVSVISSYAGDDPENFEENCAAIEEYLKEYHRLFDIYNEYEGINNLYTLNKSAGGDWVQVDVKLIDFLLWAKELYGLLGGEMNIMMGSVLSLWHDCRESSSKGNPYIPDGAELSEAAKHISMDALEIDKANLRVRITDADASIDVGAIGKGYATEMAAKYLIGKGVSGYVLNIGGNIRIIGEKPNGDGWSTGIKDPFDPQKLAVKLLLSDTSCVTSGDYERYFELDGVRYHHIIDKDTLYPAELFSSVTVVCEDSGLADALSTALFCMSYEDGLRVIDSFDGVEAFWVLRSGEEKMTDGFKDLIMK